MRLKNGLKLKDKLIYIKVFKIKEIKIDIKEKLYEENIDFFFIKLIDFLKKKFGSENWSIRHNKDYYRITINLQK